MTYTQLTQVQRYQIYSLLKMGHPQTEIARCLGVHKSTISRELRRNRGQRGYRPKQAQQKTRERRAKNGPQIPESDWRLVEERLGLDHSPEQISGWLKRQYGIEISHESIYQYIYADKRAGGRDLRGKIPDQVSIEKRPEIVDQRTRLGDWEVDLIIGVNIGKKWDLPQFM